MKIAVSAREPSLNSPFEFRFDRTRIFLIYDTESKEISTINSNLEQKSGDQVIQTILDNSVQAVITGSIGPLGTRALNNTNLLIFPFHGATVRDAVQAYENGHLSSFRSTTL